MIAKRMKGSDEGSGMIDRVSTWRLSMTKSFSSPFRRLPAIMSVLKVSRMPVVSDAVKDEVPLRKSKSTPVAVRVMVSETSAEPVARTKFVSPVASRSVALLPRAGD